MHTQSQPDLVHHSHQSGAVGGASSKGAGPSVKRRVSRVESLRNLFFNRGGAGGGGGGGGGASNSMEAKKRFLLKKRARSAEKGTEKVSAVSNY